MAVRGNAGRRENDGRILRDPVTTASFVVYVLCTTSVVVSQAGWLTLQSSRIIQSLNRHTMGPPGSHDDYDRTSAVFLLPLCVSVFS